MSKKIISGHKNIAGMEESLETHHIAVCTKIKELKEENKINDHMLSQVIALLHDIGKYAPAVQEHLRGGPRAPHAHAGAYFAKNLVSQLCTEPKQTQLINILGYIIAGHHTGLTNYVKDSKHIPLSVILDKNLKTDYTEFNDIPVTYGEEIKKILTSWCPPNIKTSITGSFYIRMLYSLLIDADCLATEEFSTGKTRKKLTKLTLNDLKPKFDTYLNTKLLSPEKLINEYRIEWLNICKLRGEDAPGLYSLTTPTGGGKTFQATAWALAHAHKHNLSRIIYVLPLTSIIEQLADLLREIFGSENVVEHQSNLDEKNIGEENLTAHMQACENWDAPIIVTTQVQFFESLYAENRSSCRKLHNIANSVVILDEIHLLSKQVLYPSLEVVKELYENYNTSFILSTATLPDVKEKHRTLICKEIIEEKNLADAKIKLRRHTCETHKHLAPCTDWNEVSTLRGNSDTALFIVNTRTDCAKLYSAIQSNMPDEADSILHLSRNMCGEHISNTLMNAKERLQKKLPTIVTSTSLINTGIDISFPRVICAVNDLLALVQSGGRCNREAEQEKGKLIIFNPPETYIANELKSVINNAIKCLKEDPDSLFDDAKLQKFYAAQTPETTIGKKILMDHFISPDYKFNFVSASKEFKLIQNNYNTEHILCTYNNGANYGKEIKAQGEINYKKIQRYIVSVPTRVKNRLLEEKKIEEFVAGNTVIFLQCDTSIYDPKLGLVFALHE